MRGFPDGRRGSSARLRRGARPSEESFTRGRPCALAGARFSTRVDRLPARVGDHVHARSASRSSIDPSAAAPGSRPARASSSRCVCRLGAILLVRSDDARGAALDPAGAVDARKGRSPTVEHAAARRSASSRSPRRTDGRGARRRGTRRCGRRSRRGSSRARRLRPRGSGRRVRRRAGSGRSPSPRPARSPRIAAGEARKRSRTVRGLPPGSLAAKPRSSSTFRWTDVGRRLELGLARRVELSSAGSTRTSAPARSPSSWSSVDVHGGLDGAAPAEDDDLLDARRRDRLDRSVGGVRGRELLARQREHPRDVERDVAVADHDRPLVRRGRTAGPGSPGGRCTRRRTRSPARSPAGPRPGCRGGGRSARRPRRPPRRRAERARRGSRRGRPRRCRGSGTRTLRRSSRTRARPP